MDVAVVMTQIFNAIRLAQMAAQLGKDALPHLKQAYDLAFGGKVLTDDERVRQEADLMAYSATLQAPLP